MRGACADYAENGLAQHSRTNPTSGVLIFCAAHFCQTRHDQFRPRHHTHTCIPLAQHIILTLSSTHQDGERGRAGMCDIDIALRLNAEMTAPPLSHAWPWQLVVRARRPPDTQCHYCIIPQLLTDTLHSMSSSSRAPMPVPLSPTRCSARPCGRTASSSSKTARARLSK